MSFRNNINFRKKTLEKFLDNIVYHEKEIIECLHKDFKKPAFESFLTETDLVISEHPSMGKTKTRSSQYP
jgi:aldehyde dehydrogenase (NAD+)